MTDASKYNFSKAERVQIFEQVGTYIETQNQYASDPELQTMVAELRDWVSHLQAQHPSIATETEALAIIDAEGQEIQPSTSRFATLRQQLLNPERHFQATKASLGEVVRHYLEESVWAKAFIAYLEALSDDPSQGA